MKNQINPVTSGIADAVWDEVLTDHNIGSTFLIFQGKVICEHKHLQLTETPIKSIKAMINSMCIRSPGDRFFINYDFIISDATVEIKPKNIFTALRLHGYNISTEINPPFKLWKNFTIGYFPKFTGFFLV